jgi:S1-C subfamily serine protease
MPFRSLISLVLALGLLPHATLADGSGTAPPAGASSTVVWCLDRERDVVHRDVASACPGSIVSDAEARAIQERREEAVAHALAAQPSGPEGLRFASLGTAFYVDGDGTLLTNRHVVADCKAVQVRSLGRPPINAAELAVDQMHDLALLHAGARSPGVAVFRSGAMGGIAPGVAAVGYPNEGLPALQPQRTAGTLLRSDDGSGRMLISIDVRHGNSGGPILDSGGLVIGVVVAKVNTAAVYARTGEQVGDTGVGIPIATVLEFLTRNHVQFHSSSGARALDGTQVLAEADAFVARAECWR